MSAYIRPSNCLFVKNNISVLQPAPLYYTYKHPKCEKVDQSNGRKNYFNCPHKQRRDSHDEKSNAKNLFYSVTFVYSAYWLLRQKASESAVSPEAEAVITAMFTAPNEELYSQDASNVIGENTDANSDDAFANSEKILENWNKLVGKYFERDRLEYFVSTYGQTYLSEAAVNNTQIAVKDISLDSKTDDSGNSSCDF